MKYLETFENYGKYDKLVDHEKNPMLRGYIEAALFADLAEEYTGEYGSEDINDNSLIEAYNDISSFKKSAGSLLDGMDTETLSQVGMDFWYCRNHHGVGFFDREDLYGVDKAKALDVIASEYAPLNVEVVNGEIIFE